MKRPVRHKYGAQSIEHDGIKFSSKLEGRYYQQLKMRQSSGDVLFFLRQVPIHLAGGTKYVCDFEVFLSDGTVEFVDVKGFETELFKLKRKQVEASYPFEIKIIKKV
jgi:hypothetical protein